MKILRALLCSPICLKNSLSTQTDSMVMKQQLQLMYSIVHLQGVWVSRPDWCVWNRFSDVAKTVTNTIHTCVRVVALIKRGVAHIPCVLKKLNRYIEMLTTVVTPLIHVTESIERERLDHENKILLKVCSKAQRCWRSMFISPQKFDSLSWSIPLQQVPIPPPPVSIEEELQEQHETMVFKGAIRRQSLYAIKMLALQRG